jgi:sugar phosphate isomerase/epimerase
MPDQSAEAILRYVLDSGISRIEFMGGPVEAFAGAPPSGGFRGGGRGGPPPTPEQQAAQREAAERLRGWRTSVSMDRFKALRKMFNDAGVTIYAWKQLSPNMSDGEMEYVFNVAEALGCTHTTLELIDDAEPLRRIGQFAEKKKIYAAYHTHLQGSMTAFDQAFAVSKANMANVDLGHFVAAGGDPVAFIKKFNGRISSVHLKDRTRPANGQGNVPWGTGDTPLKEILLTMKRDRHAYPAAIELEYEVPSGSDAVKETAKCLDFCKAVLAKG